MLPSVIQSSIKRWVCEGFNYFVLLLVRDFSRKKRQGGAYGNFLHLRGVCVCGEDDKILDHFWYMSHDGN